ncbi:hypothetical protein SALBM217S_04918 [Streptomyces griseoloalbus]
MSGGPLGDPEFPVDQVEHVLVGGVDQFVDVRVRRVAGVRRGGGGRRDSPRGTPPSCPAVRAARPRAPAGLRGRRRRGRPPRSPAAAGRGRCREPRPRGRARRRGGRPARSWGRRTRWSRAAGCRARSRGGCAVRRRSASRSPCRGTPCPCGHHRRSRAPWRRGCGPGRKRRRRRWRGAGRRVRRAVRRRPWCRPARRPPPRAAAPAGTDLGHVVDERPVAVRAVRRHEPVPADVGDDQGRVAVGHRLAQRPHGEPRFHAGTPRRSSCSPTSASTMPPPAQRPGDRGGGQTRPPRRRSAKRASRWALAGGVKGRLSAVAPDAGPRRREPRQASGRSTRRGDSPAKAGVQSTATPRAHASPRDVYRRSRPPSPPAQRPYDRTGVDVGRLHGFGHRHGQYGVRAHLQERAVSGLRARAPYDRLQQDGLTQGCSTSKAGVRLTGVDPLPVHRRQERHRRLTRPR